MKLLFLFSLGSVVGAVVDFLITLFLLFHSINAFISLAVSMTFSATLIYFYHEYLTFNDQRNSHFSKMRLSKFLISTLMIYGFRVAIFYGLTAVHVLEVIALLIALVSSVFINYFVSKLLIFKN